MKCQLILKKFDLDLDKLKKKLDHFQISTDKIANRLQISGNIDLGELQKVSEIDRVLVEEKEASQFKLEDLRKDMSKLGKNKFHLQIKTYNSVKIPPGSLKKKLYPIIKENENSKNKIILELFKEKEKTFYRIFSYQEKGMQDKSKYSNITVLIENPRLVEEISDFLRLCLIFNLKFKVIHSNKNEFERMLNKAKSMTKGKLSDFKVEVVKDLSKTDGIKIGFSKHAQKDEKEFIEFLKNNNKNLLFIFGNDTFGLTQQARDKLDYSFSLTPDKVKPLKANQALAYILGIYTSLR
ncbi:hypothetical protein HY500_00385 [Candidatus Woesearchaeota archaeon]|nr:hypothetical protein [Candidatus Woesearchaeota archaeon]